MKKMTQQQLHSLIDRYFNAETSQAEEKMLRKYLCTGKYALTPEVEEAIAVMSVQRQAQSSKQSVKSASASHFISAAKWLSAAAVCGVIAIVGVKFANQPQQADCYAYVGGKYTDDPTVLSNMMNSQMSELSQQMQLTQSAIDNQLSDLSDAMKEFENN